jgi:hypothetical protein
LSWIIRQFTDVDAKVFEAILAAVERRIEELADASATYVKKVCAF